jgi:hypothetical protein
MSTVLCASASTPSGICRERKTNLLSKYKIQIVFAALVTLGTALSVPVQADGIFGSSYNAGTVFTDALTSTSAGIAFDGQNFYAASGGGSGGVHEAQYNAAGSVSATYSPRLGFDSIFIGPGGAVQARQFDDRTIYSQTAPGAFTSALTLTGGFLGVQNSVVYDGVGDYDSLNSGIVSRWTAAGTALPTVNLFGYGTVPLEANWPQSLILATAGDYWLTYSNETLSAWDFGGNRVGTTTLTGAGTSFSSDYGFSYTDGQVFVVDNIGQSWRGYDVGLSTPATPEPGVVGLLVSGGTVSFGLLRRRRRRK